MCSFRFLCLFRPVQRTRGSSCIVQRIRWALCIGKCLEKPRVEEKKDGEASIRKQMYKNHSRTGHCCKGRGGSWCVILMQRERWKCKNGKKSNNGDERLMKNYDCIVLANVTFLFMTFLPFPPLWSAQWMLLMDWEGSRWDTTSGSWVPAA